MAYAVRTEQKPTGGNRDGTVYILEDQAGSARAEIWPGLGFNCYRWQAACAGRYLNLIYAGPELFLTGHATRSGIPTLFPFPNRIRDGRFHWLGKDYNLPRNSAGRHAIHGFTFDRAWRVVDQGADLQSAWLTGEFRGFRDAPDTRDFWPADYQIRLTYRLSSDRLRLEAVVSNPDDVALPFGLGFHPYFRTPWTPNTSASDCWVEARAHAYWELLDCIPTGARNPVDSIHNLITPRHFTELHLDDVLTEVDNSLPPTGSVRLCGTLRQPLERVEIRLSAAPDFRELVVYTPSHRQAIALEPYTCTTDAINLQQQGIDAGWRTLQPGTSWSADIEMVIAPSC